MYFVFFFLVQSLVFSAVAAVHGLVKHRRQQTARLYFPVCFNSEIAAPLFAFLCVFPSCYDSLFDSAAAVRLAHPFLLRGKENNS